MSGRKKKRLAADAYLNAVRPLAAELIEYLTGSEEYEIGCETARGCGFRDATILFVNSAGKKYGISKAGTSISDDRLCSSRGFVIRVYDGAPAPASDRAVHSADSRRPAPGRRHRACGS